MKKGKNLTLFLVLVLVGALLLSSLPALAGENPGQGKSLIEARKALEQQLRGRPGFVGIAHSEESGEIVVFVETEQAKGIVRSRFEGSPVRVEVTGRMEALSLQVAEPVVPGRANQVSSTRTRRVRPLVGGLSVSAYVAGERWSGTLGMVTYDNMILSNAHVIAMDLSYNFLPEGTPIIQPGGADARLWFDEVGGLEAYIPIDFTEGAVNYADAAVGSIYSGVGVSPGEQFDEGGNYWVEGWTEVSVGDTVRKSGRTTGVTTGEVVEVNASFAVSYGGQIAYFEDQILVSGSLSKQGDSGSVVDKDGAFVGLVFAGSSEYTIVCKAEHIIDGLDIVVVSPLAIVTARLPAGEVGIAYEATLQAIGGSPPYTWAITGGALPDGLSLQQGSGVISGTPTKAGTFNFTVGVTDDEGSTATRNLSITITETLIYQLTVSSSQGGSVINPGEGVFPYEKGTAVDLAASAAGGYRFVNWTGDVDTVANVNADSTTITMNGDYSITANFEMWSPCQAHFTADKTEIEVGATVIFTNETAGGNPPYLSAAWDFDGDGTADSTAAVQPGETVSWAYDEPGLYSVSLAITGIHATCTETRHDYITVYTEVVPDEPDLAAVLESIADQLVIVYYYAGSGVWDVYWPEFGIDTIGRLEVGKVYIIYVASDCTLGYGKHSYELNGPDWNFIYWFGE